MKNYFMLQCTTTLIILFVSILYHMLFIKLCYPTQYGIPFFVFSCAIECLIIVIILLQTFLLLLLFPKIFFFCLCCHKHKHFTFLTLFLIFIHHTHHYCSSINFTKRTCISSLFST